MIDWFKDRLQERTTMDGIALVVVGAIILLAGPLAKIAAIGSIAYGAWTIWKAE